MIHQLADVQSINIGKNTKIWQYAIILKGAIIGDECNINCHTFIESKATIGNRVTIKPGVFIWDGIIIEDDVMIGPNVTFTNDKWPKSKNVNYQLLETFIGKGTSIGANATILCGLRIGEFVLVGAGSIVTKDIPNRALVIGSQAKIVGWMNEDGTKMHQIDNENYIDINKNKWKVINNQLILDENPLS